MPVFKLSPIQLSHAAQGSRLDSFVSLPRYLHAAPLLLVLTTAIAWGASAHAGGLVPASAPQAGSGVTVAAGPGVAVGLGTSAGVKATTGLNADVRTGANANVTAGQRRAATGEAGAGTDAQTAGGVEAAEALSGATEGVGRTLGSVRDTGQAVGGTAARTRKMAARGAKAEASGSLKGTAQTGSQGAAGAGVEAGVAAGARAGVPAAPGAAIGY